VCVFVCELQESMQNMFLGVNTALPEEGSYYQMGLPNEVSLFAGTNLLHYRCV